MFSFKFQGPSGPPFELLRFRQAKNGASIAALPAVSPSKKKVSSSDLVTCQLEFGYKWTTSSIRRFARRSCL